MSEQVAKRHRAQSVLDPRLTCDVCLRVFAQGARGVGGQSTPQLADENGCLLPAHLEGTLRELLDFCGFNFPSFTASSAVTMLGPYARQHTDTSHLRVSESINRVFAGQEGRVS